MNKKRLFVVSVLLLALLGIGMGVAALIPPAPGVTTANFDRIHKGMTEDEVRGIFGNKGLELRTFNARQVNCENGKKKMRWLVNDWTCADILFIDGLVVEKSWAGNPTPTFFDRILCWHCD